jgi:acetyl esterase/lipase
MAKRTARGRVGLLLTLLVFGCAPAHAKRRAPVEQTTMDLPLWPRADSVELRVFLPQSAAPKNRPAFVVLRGGAYATSSGSGAGSARWLSAHGIVATEVPYRTQSSGDAHPAAYADAARALRLIRSRAGELGVDPARIGVLGYSAGGHLASLLSTRPDLPPDPSDDLAASTSARPDLVVLGYPLISFVEGYSPGAFVGSVENFFGRRGVDQAQRREFSNELHVTSAHPPVFVWTTRDDALVPASHSELFAAACRRAGVPVELELFPSGPHGLGLALEETSEVRNWTEHLLRWLHASWGAF